ncbi:MAG: hypothetical protein JWM51_1980, partial [Microbacteriaceae bacterium]|nr:hypothetical protein [Microbacteriaceae bacterium]
MSCGCGDGTHGWWCDERVATTPLPVSNRPGLPVIRRRVATHATAKATMLQALSRPGLIALHELTRRTDDDFSVALLDTAATAVDIVTFYTDRHVNEQYLRTATEQRSVAALARLIGYAPQPAIAPTVDLAFTLETAPGAPVRTRVPVGTAVQSNPEPGQPPAVYETLHDLDASPAWNALRPRARRRHGAPGTRVSLAGTVTGIAAGDGVLFRAGPGDRSVTFALVSKVTNVDAVPALPGVPGSPPRTELEISPVGTKNADPSVEPLPSTGTLPGMPASVEWIDEPSLSAAALDAGLLARSLDIDDIVAPLAAPSGSPGQVALFRQQRALAGSQAPPSSSIAATIALASALPNVPANIYSWAKPLILPWEAATADHYKSIGAAGDVYLDGASPGVPAGSLVVLRSDDKWAAYAVTKAAAESVTVFATTGRCIRLSLTPKTGLGEFSVRRTTAYAAPEYFALADVPVVEPLTSATIELDGLQLGLREGRPVVL